MSYTDLGNRPELSRRAIYEPHSDVERFIVPLLKREITAILEKYCGRGDNSTILDVGCGRQPFRKMLESRSWRYVGMDTQVSEGEDVAIVGPIDSPLPPLGLQQESYDAVLCTEVLEHVADWTSAFRNLAWSLKPGGFLLLTCPHFYIPHEEPYDFWRPTPNAVRYYAARENLEVISLRGCGTAWDILGTLLAVSDFAPVTQRITDRVLSRLARFGRRWLLEQLYAGRAQSHLHLRGPMFISVVGVLRKPAMG